MSKSKRFACKTWGEPLDVELVRSDVWRKRVWSKGAGSCVRRSFLLSEHICRSDFVVIKSRTPQSAQGKTASREFKTK